MAIGNYESCLENNKIKKIIRNTIGTFDYHSHIRIKPLLRYIKKNQNCKTILEIGCGGGQIGFELHKILKFDKYIGVDLNKISIEKGNSICRKLEINNMLFLNCDAFEFLKMNEEITNNVDVVILYDFLEHINNPEEFLGKLKKILKNKNIIYIISVPTPLYSKVFGKVFYKKIGHIKDGFNLKEIKKMFMDINCQIINYSYNTGLIGNIGAFIYYNLLKESKGNFFRIIITFPFRIFDINSDKVSSSLFAIFRKR